MYAALKQVNITSEEELEDFSVEINILAECVHPNVVGLVDAYFFQSKLWVSCGMFFDVVSVGSQLLFSDGRIVL